MLVLLTASGPAMTGEPKYSASLRFCGKTLKTTNCNRGVLEAQQVSVPVKGKSTINPNKKLERPKKCSR